MFGVHAVGFNHFLKQDYHDLLFSYNSCNFLQAYFLFMRPQKANLHICFFLVFASAYHVATLVFSVSDLVTAQWTIFKLKSKGEKPTITIPTFSSRTAAVEITTDTTGIVKSTTSTPTNQNLQQ